jgi:hypothetical protein
VLEYTSFARYLNDNALISLMPVFGPVLRTLEKAHVPYLVIGGHAVILLGFLRNTFDLDILIAEEFLNSARLALGGIGYSKYFETDAFLQLQAPVELPPVDLMIVDAQTFSRLIRFTEHRVLDGERILIPDALRLVALKLHAIRSATRSRQETDWQDIVGILRAARQDLENTEFKEIVERYGGPAALAEIRQRLGETR